MQKVVFEYLRPNQGPVPGSWFTPLLTSCRKAWSNSSLPGLASSWMKYALFPGVSSTPFRMKLGWEGSSWDQLGCGSEKGSRSVAVLVIVICRSFFWF